MTRTAKLNVALLAALALTLALHALLAGPASRPNLEVIPEMVRTERFNAFAPNPVFPDGKTLQAPPPGTLSRELPPLPYAATPEDALRAGAELQSPYPAPDAAARERGKAVFASYCQACHGDSGRGDGLVPSRGFPAPPSLLADHARGLKDGHLFHIASFGQRNMSSYAGQVSREDRWKAVLFIRSLQAAAAPGAKP